MAVTHATLVVFVPGIRAPRAPAGVRDVIESEGRVFLDDSASAPEEKTFGGCLGVRFKPSEDRVVDIAEVSWENPNTRLSAQPFFERIRFFVKLLPQLPRRAKAVVCRSSLAFQLLSIAMTLILITWVWLVGSTALLVAGKALKDANVTCDLWNALQPVCAFVHPVKAFFDPLSWRYIAALVFVLAIWMLGIDINTFVDVTDAYERYLNEGTVFGSSLKFRKVVVQTVVDAVRAAAVAGPGLEAKTQYDRIVVLGHSFGTLVAADAAPHCGIAVELVTISAFFEYLKVVNGPGIRPILKALRSPCVTRWRDFYSPADVLSAGRPLRCPPPRYTSLKVTLKGVGLLDQAVMRAHLFYFSEPEVLREIFCGDPAANR